MGRSAKSVPGNARLRTCGLLAPLQHRNAHVEIVGGQVGVAHGHLQGLVAQPHLHAANVDPALNQTGSAGMAQAVRHQLHIGRKADLRPCLMPDLPEFRLLDAREGAYALAVAACDGRAGAFSERDGAAPARLGEPEGDAAFVNVAPAQADRLA